MRLVYWHVGKTHVFVSARFIGICIIITVGMVWLTWPVVWPVLSVGLDAGHGGIDPGAVGSSGLKEKHVTLNVARKIAVLLEETGNEAYLIRTEDRRLGSTQRSDLKARVYLAHDASVDILISVHCNGFHQSYVRGPRTYYHPGSQKGRLLASYIQQELVSLMANGSNEPTAGDYLITRESSMVAVIVELGYITNPSEERLLGNPDFQNRLARAVVNGIVRYSQG